MKHAVGYVLAVASVVFAGGCSKSEPLDIGEGKHTTGALGASLADYAGNWDGHAEAYQFDDGSDRIRLSIDEDGTGVLEVGDSPALPAPDPDHGYPPSAPADEKGYPGDYGTHGFYSGFEYPIDGANVEAKRIRFTALTREVFREWCELQTPGLNIGAIPESYSCAPGGFAGMWDGMSSECTTGPDAAPIDCGKASLCLSVCTCDKDSCTIYDETDSQFDAVLQEDGEQLEGTLVIAGTRVVVRMDRQ
jgi:hypothetical protein